MSRGLNSRRGGRRFTHRFTGGAPVIWLPSDDASALHWYRGDDTVDVSGVVQTWPDRIGSGNLTQGTASARPTPVTRWGQRALSFDGGDALRGALGATVEQPFAWFFVIEFSSLAVTTQFLTDDSETQCIVQVRSSDRAWGLYAGSQINGGTATTGTIYAGCAVINGANSALYINDFRDGQAVATGNVGTRENDGLGIGDNWAGTNPLNGFFGEAVMRSGAPDAATRALYAQYLTARYEGLEVTV